jgi:hypothetical protein
VVRVRRHQRRVRTVALAAGVVAVAAIGWATVSVGNDGPTTPNGATITPGSSSQSLTGPYSGPDSGCVEVGGLADRHCTPGVTNPAVTQATIHSTICVAGYTRTVRPPVSYTGPLKRRLMRAYGLTGPLSLYELDHLIPLELGSAPSAVANLWPEPWGGPHGAHVKDAEENALRRAVCDGSITLVAAQARIVSEWTR